MSGFLYWSMFCREQKHRCLSASSLRKIRTFSVKDHLGAFFEQVSMLVPTTLALLEFSSFLLLHCAWNVLLHPVLFIRIEWLNPDLKDVTTAVEIMTWLESPVYNVCSPIIDAHGVMPISYYSFFFHISSFKNVFFFPHTEFIEWLRDMYVAQHSTLTMRVVEHIHRNHSWDDIWCVFTTRTVPQLE